MYNIPYVKTILRAIISLALIITLIYFIGMDKIKNEILKANPIFFILAICIENAGVFISSKKWQLLLKSKGIKMSFGDTLSYYYMGSFFNAFMPSSIGGDVIKAYKMGRKTDMVESFSSVVMDRLTGLIAVLLIGGSSILWYRNIPSLALKLCGAIFVIFILLLFLLLKTNFFERIADKIFFKREFFLNLISSIKEYGGNEIVILAIMISLSFHLLLILNNYILSISLGLKIPVFYFFIFIPVAEIIVFLPITIQGFGVRETTYAILFHSIGIDYASSFSLGFLNQLVKIITSMIGGIVYAIKK